jgi:transcriptional regulator with XRE-family HTH domain
MRRKPARAEQYKMPEFKESQRRIAANAQRLRARRNWTQLQAALHCEMDAQHYYRIEAGALNLTLTTLARLARGFEVDLRELFEPIAPARNAKR